MDVHSRKLLIIGFVWPEPESSAAGHRMMQLISLFQSEGWKITFASAAAETGYMADLEALGIDTARIEINSSTFDAFVRKLQPDVVVFDRFVTEEQFGWRVAKQCPGALRILDTEDLHCLRRARQNAVREQRPFVQRDLLAGETARREIGSILRSDLTLIISEAELDLLADVAGVDRTLLHYLPFLLEPVDKRATRQWPPFEERKHFVTVGNFRHAPNLDSIQYLKREIWPLVRAELPDTELHIYGAYPSQQAMQMDERTTGFRIRGRAKEAAEVVRSARVCLAPLRFGAGLKGKLVEAMQCGTPNVTTRVGAEGIAGNLAWGGCVADKPRDIADAAVRLYTDRSVWKRAQENGIRIINRRFDKTEFAWKLIGRITGLQQRINEHRLEHFTGEILMHHTMASTKYMAKWIEEKNR